MSAGTSTLKAFVETVNLTNAAVKYYTVPPGVPNLKAQVTSVVISNWSAAPHNIFIYNVPFGGAPANGNLIFGGNAIPANTTWIETVGGDGVEIWTMAAGGEIWAKADANTVINLTISGREISG